MRGCFILDLSRQKDTTTQTIAVSTVSYSTLGKSAGVVQRPSGARLALCATSGRVLCQEGACLLAQTSVLQVKQLLREALLPSVFVFISC